MNFAISLRRYCLLLNQTFTRYAIDVDTRRGKFKKLTINTCEEIMMIETMTIKLLNFVKININR